MESMRENDNNSDEEYTATQELPKGGNPFINSPEYKKWLEDHHLIEPRCAGYMDKGGWHDGESGKESGKNVAIDFDDILDVDDVDDPYDDMTETLERINQLMMSHFSEKYRNLLNTEETENVT